MNIKSRLKELAAKSDDWRTGGYIGYATGGIPNAYQGMEIQQYYGNKGVEYRKRDALKHAAPGFLAGAIAAPIGLLAAKKIVHSENIRTPRDARVAAIMRRSVGVGIPLAAVIGVNALYGGKKQAVPDREKRIKSREFSSGEYDRLKEKNIDSNMRKVSYIDSNVASYPSAALGGGALGLATGGLLLGRRGVTKKAALIGAAGMIGARAAMQPKINKWEDRALKKDGFLDTIKDDSGLFATRYLPFLAGTAGTAAILMNRAKILNATGKLAKKFRAARVARPGKWEVIPPPKGDLPVPTRLKLT